MNKKGLGLLVSISLVLTLVVAGCGTTKAPAPSQTAATSPDLATKVDALQKDMDLQKKSINPGLGTVMIEYNDRMGRLWFAGEAGNWDMVKYQILEMKEIQETGEVDRPARAEALKGFEKGYLDPITATADKKDKAAFETAYDKTIAGCNACHVGQKSTDFTGGYKFVKIVKPTQPPTVNVDYAGQK